MNINQSTPPSAGEILVNIKPELRGMRGYAPPPQGSFRAKLNQNENPYDLPPPVKRAILDDMEKREWTRYPSYQSSPLRAALAARFSLEPERILVSGGSNTLLFAVGAAVLSPGDRFVTAPPTFGLFETVGRVNRARMVPVDRKPAFDLDVERLAAEAGQAKLTMLCSPNNPTGKVIPKAVLERVLKSTKGLVLFDEAYVEFGGWTARPMLDVYPNLLILRTMSKAYGLAGLRLGYLLGSSGLLAEIEKAVIPYNVGLFGEIAARHLLSSGDWMEKGVRLILAERGRLFERLAGDPRVTVYPSKANFILVRVPDVRRVVRALMDKGVLVRPVDSHPLLEDCFRVTVGRPEENDLFLESLDEALSPSSPGRVHI